MNRNSRLHKVSKSTAALLLFTPIVAYAATTEIVAKRLACESVGSMRVIELVYEDPVVGLPCVIREQKQGEAPRVLWRARYQADFCVNQMESYRDKLWSAGLRCDWLSGDDTLHSISADSAPRVPANRLQAPLDTVKTVSWTIFSTESDIPDRVPAVKAPTVRKQTLAQSLESSSQGKTGYAMMPILDADTNVVDDAFSLLKNNPLISEQFSAFADSEKSLDSWVFELNGKTLAAIKELLVAEPATFEEYLSFEQKNAQTIYSKLQLRIRHLTAIAKHQQQHASVITSQE